MSAWYADFEKGFLSYIDACLNKGKKKENRINVTNREAVREKAKFPTVFLKVIEMNELGRDLTNETINAVSISVQIQVIDTRPERVVSVADECVSLMKKLRFNISNFPIPAQHNELIYNNFRCTRVIGSREEIFW